MGSRLTGISVSVSGQQTITAWFHYFIQRNKLPPCSIHSLRQGKSLRFPQTATLLIASGAPIKTVSKRLGHSNVSTTGNIYIHAIQSADEAAAEALEDILSPIKRSKLKAFPKAE
jgi:integrase